MNGNYRDNCEYKSTVTVICHSKSQKKKKMTGICKNYI